jgi:Cro/C1-type HTH DNA-binding domain
MVLAKTDHLDLRHLKRLIRLRGYTNASLARETGMQEWEIRRLLKGESEARWGEIVDIATVLEVPSGDLVCSIEHNIPHKSVQWHELSSIAALYQFFPGLRVYLECIKSPPMYVQPSGVHEWSFRSAQESIGWHEQDITGFLPIVTQRHVLSAKMRSDYKFVHRIICPEFFFRLAFRNDLHWSSDYEDLLHGFRGRTVLGLVPTAHWHQVDDIVSKAVHAQFQSSVWYKVAVFDGAAAVVRLKPELYVVSFHAPTVRKLEEAITQAATHVPYDFPLGFDDTRRSFNESMDRLVKVAMRADSDAISLAGRDERAYWQQLAFQS